jgi:hypothetical protein
VIQGEAEVFFILLVDQICIFITLRMLKMIIFWKMFSNYPSGGGTDISRIVTSNNCKEVKDWVIKN